MRLPEGVGEELEMLDEIAPEVEEQHRLQQRQRDLLGYKAPAQGTLEAAALDVQARGRQQPGTGYNTSGGASWGSSWGSKPRAFPHCTVLSRNRHVACKYGYAMDVVNVVGTHKHIQRESEIVAIHAGLLGHSISEMLNSLAITCPHDFMFHHYNASQLSQLACRPHRLQASHQRRLEWWRGVPQYTATTLRFQDLFTVLPPHLRRVMKDCISDGTSTSPSYIGGPPLQYFCNHGATPPSSVATLILLDPRHQRLLQKWGTILLVYPGFNTPNLIISGGNAATPQHKEDGNAAAMNLLLGGACKAWCVMRQPGVQAFEAELKWDEEKLIRTLRKQRFDSLALACKLDSQNVFTMLQYSGQLVVTLTGSVASDHLYGCQSRRGKQCMVWLR